MRRIDITSQKFGKLTVLNYMGVVGGKSFYLCICECGNYKKGSYYHLTRGITTSCGCGTHEKLSKGSDATHKQLLYGVYCGIKARCNNPNTKAFVNYGGRGIKICNEWSEYENFKKWSLENGYTEGLTIERIDNDGDYCPGNCCFIPKREQAKNRRSTVWVEVGDKLYTAQEITVMYGVSPATVSRWVKAGIIHEKLKNGKDTSHNKGRSLKKCTA